MSQNIDAILNIINGSKDHPTVEQIYLRMKESEHKVVLATVYNNLKSLLNRGLIMKISVEGFPDRYDIATKHDHLLCSECGRLSDVYLDDLTDSLQEQVEVEIKSYDLKISYICPACRKKQKKTQEMIP